MRLNWGGFELNEIHDLTLTPTGSPTIVTTAPHGGSYCMRFNAASQYAQIPLVPGTPAAGRDYFFRVYMRISGNPSGQARVLEGIATGPTTDFGVTLETNGTLVLRDTTGAQIGNASPALALNVWHRLELYFNIGTISTGKIELRLNGSTIAASSTANLGTLATQVVAIGQRLANAIGVNLDFDCYAVNDGQAGAGGTSWCGDAKIVYLPPTGDSSVGTGWTNDAAAAVNLFNAVKGLPPAGIADTTTGTGLHQIRNATSNANSAYVANMASYTAAGLLPTDTITLVQWGAAFSAPVSTSAKSGSARIASNPAEAALDSFGTFYSAGAGAAGAYSVGWNLQRGPTIDSSLPGPASYGTAPTMAVNQITSSTRIAMCCMMTILVEYTSFSGGPSVVSVPSVQRAATRMQAEKRNWWRPRLWLPARPAFAGAYL